MSTIIRAVAYSDHYLICIPMKILVYEATTLNLKYETDIEVGDIITCAVNDYAYATLVIY